MWVEGLSTPRGWTGGRNQGLVLGVQQGLRLEAVSYCFLWWRTAGWAPTISTFFQLMQIIEGYNKMYETKDYNSVDDFVNSVSVGLMWEGNGEDSHHDPTFTFPSLCHYRSLFQFVENSCLDVMGKEIYFVCLEGKSYSHYSRPRVNVCGCMSMGCVPCVYDYAVRVCVVSVRLSVMWVLWVCMVWIQCKWKWCFYVCVVCVCMKW